MTQPRLVVIGNGMAGIRTLEELLAIAPGHYDITVFGAEPHPNYNRILLASHLRFLVVRSAPVRIGELYRAPAPTQSGGCGVQRR